MEFEKSLLIKMSPKILIKCSPLHTKDTDEFTDEYSNMFNFLEQRIIFGLTNITAAWW